MNQASDCLFCGISTGKIDAKLIHEDDQVFAFEDINPQAPHHILICPREHLSTLNDITAAHEPVMGHLVRVASEIASARGDAESGYRLVANCQEGAGQSVFHIHFHLMGGRTFTWPPG